MIFIPRHIHCQRFLDVTSHKFISVRSLLGVGDPITFLDSDPTITFTKVIVTILPVTLDPITFRIIAIRAERLQDCKTKYSPT